MTHEEQKRMQELEHVLRQCWQAYYAPPMDAPPVTDEDHRQVSEALRRALDNIPAGVVADHQSAVEELMGTLENSPNGVL